MRRISETLRSTFAKLGIGGAVARAGALEAWSGAARVCLGDDATRTRALRIDDGTLVVGVRSPVLAQELRLRSADVLAELARRAPDSGVVAVRFVPR
jgi:hypothetical protein